MTPDCIELVGGPLDGRVVPYPFDALFIPVPSAPGRTYVYRADGAVARYDGVL